LLFQSLREHTQEEIRWSVLDEDWKNARDKCAAIVPVFFTETQSLINDYIENANDPGFLKSLKKITKKDDPVQIITNTITNVMWRSFTSGGLYKESSPSFETIKRDKSENVNVITIRSGDEILFSLVGEDKEYLANKVTVTCNAVIRVLAEQKTMPELRREVGNLKKASDDLRVMLNPLKLRPLILRTRCEICPV